MIDPVEAIVAETGLGLLTGARQAKVTEAEIKSARELEPFIAAQAKRSINRTLPPKPPKQLNYKRTLSRLAKLANHAELTERHQWFPPGYQRLATAYNIFLNELQEEVLKMLPRQTWETIAGVETGPPNDLKLWRFMTVFEVVNDPLSVFTLISNGMLLKKQALAVKSIYPTLAQAITATLFNVVVEKKAGGWAPDFRTQQGLANWFEVSAIPSSMLLKLQANHMAAVKGQQNNPAAPQPMGQAVAQNGGPSQQAQFGAVTAG